MMTEEQKQQRQRGSQKQNQRKWTLVRQCFAVALICSAWNLYGDLYYLDYYTVFMSQDEFAMPSTPTTNGCNDDNSSQCSSGYIFTFSKETTKQLELQPSAVLTQAGGWMYPIWAFVTCVPLYLGLSSSTGGTEDQYTRHHQQQQQQQQQQHYYRPNFWRTAAPCWLLAYGLCVVGGALHSAFSFLNVLPGLVATTSASSNYNNNNDDDDAWETMMLSAPFTQFIKMAQNGILQRLYIGCLPGYIACNLASLWLAYITVTIPQSNHTPIFPRWFVLFNPIITMIWISFLSFFCLSYPWDFYIIGSLGTLCVLFFNIGISYFLWNVQLDQIFFDNKNNGMLITIITTKTNDNNKNKDNNDNEYGENEHILQGK